MEALEPVLKQKFWILLGMGVIMTFTGWWMATGAMAQQTNERKTKIKSAEDGVPKGEVPNESWSKRLGVVNASQESSNNVTKMGLWKRQLSKMVIPQGLDQTLAYQGKFTSEDREVFRDMYPDEVRKVWKMLNPMDIDGSGVVNFPLTSMFKLMNQKPWLLSAPKSEVIWDILEDLWLLEGLFQSIAEVNGGPEATRMEAVVHQIDKLELRGGGEKIAGGGAGGGGNGNDMAMSFSGMSSGAMTGPMAGPMAGAGGGASGVGSAPMTPVSAEFDVREEFGDDGSGASGGGARGASMMSPMMMASASDGGGGGAPAAATENVVKRYVSDEPNKPFKTRGFYLSVKMDHRRIPQLIAELTANEKSVWPVEILRVQMSRLHEDEITAGGGSGGYGGGAMRPGPGARFSGGFVEEGMNPSAMMPQGGSLGGFPGGSEGGDDYSRFINPNSPGGVPAVKTRQALEAQAALENTLRDPYMAQVTICGVFTMYRKVEEPEAKPATTPVQNPEETAKAEGGANETANETTPAATTADTQPAAETSSDPLTESGSEEKEGDMPDSPAAKTEEEKTKPEPKSESDLK
jgi:hypothetical protein